MSFSTSPIGQQTLRLEAADDDVIADLEYLRDGGDDGDWECWEIGLSRYESSLYGGDVA